MTPIYPYPDLEQRANLEDILRFAYETVLVGTTEIARSDYLESLGFKRFDVLYLACAESGGNVVKKHWLMGRLPYPR